MNVLFVFFSEVNQNNKVLSDIMFNQKIMGYPLLSMSYVYGCKCSNNYVHNKCLLNIGKCPTCRRESEPNLYIYTKYYYLKFLLNWLKRDISHIVKLNWYMIYCLVFVLGLLFIFSINQEKISKIIPPKSKISLCFSVIISFIFGFHYTYLHLLMITLKKYWLCNEKTKIYDVFNFEPESENHENYDNTVQL